MVEAAKGGADLPRSLSKGIIVTNGLPESTTFSRRRLFVGGCAAVLGIAEEYNPCRRMRNRCKAYVRFVNLSANSPSLDVAITGGVRLFENVPYTAHTRYVPIDPGTYEMQLKPAGSNQQGIATQPIELMQCTAATVYAVGNAVGEPPLEAITSVDGGF